MALGGVREPHKGPNKQGDIMLASLNMTALVAELQQLSSFRCIDLQLVEEEEENCLIVHATVGSARDRKWLIDTLNRATNGQAMLPFIQIDPLLNTPFCPSMPRAELGQEKSRNALALPFFEGGEFLADDEHHKDKGLQ